MKKIILILVLLTSIVFAQDNNFSCYYDTLMPNETLSKIEQAIKERTTYREVIILAKDYGSTNTIPGWFNNILTQLPTFFADATFNNFMFSFDLITDNGAAFIMPQPYNITFNGTCEHVHKESNVQFVIEEADGIWDFNEFDYDHDGYVDVHFVSIGSFSGGVGNTCWTFLTNDLDPYGNRIRVRITKQTRGSGEDVLKNVFYHESGHKFFNFPDMDHMGSNSFNHYALGSFDVMSAVGFQGIPSLYNPHFRNKKSWYTPTPAINGTVTLQDFQESHQALIFSPTLPPVAVQQQQFYLTYHTRDSYFYSRWPFPHPEIGGALIWHSSIDFGYNNSRRLPIDIECAHGKYDWNETPTNVINTGIANPLLGRDSLEIRKTAPNSYGHLVEIAGPYFGVDKGSSSIFYSPDEGLEFTPFTNPNSNLMLDSDEYSQSIISGIYVKNFHQPSSGILAADILINNFEITGEIELTKGIWYINNSITINSNGRLIIPAGTELRFKAGASLNCLGSLIVNGTQAENVFFKFNKNGSRINISNASEVNITYAKIDNADIGLNINNCEPHISRSEILNCNTGINLIECYYQPGEWYGSMIDNCSFHDNLIGLNLSSSSPYLISNNFENNNVGFNCLDFSTPYLGQLAEPGTNSFYRNDTHIYNCYSYPVIGIDGEEYIAGFNTFEESANYHIVAEYESYVMAENNCWQPLDDRYFIENFESIIDYLPVWECSKGNVTNVQKSNNDFISAVKAFVKGELKKSTSICKKMIKDLHNDNFLIYPFDLLFKLVKTQNDKDSLRILADKYLRKNNNKFLKDYYHIMQTKLSPENFLTPLKNCIDSSTTDIKLLALYKLYTYYFKNSQPDSMQIIFNIMQNLYPNSSLTNYLTGQNHFSPKISISKETISSEDFSIINYPNPFNPQTNLHFNFPFKDRVKIVLYDIIGNELKVLADAVMEPGEYDMEIDGSKYASGIYLVRIYTPNFTKTHKILLIK